MSNEQAYVEALKLKIWTLTKEVNFKFDLLKELRDELERFESYMGDNLGED
jgi:hypothetical protein